MNVPESRPPPPNPFRSAHVKTYLKKKKISIKNSSQKFRRLDLQGLIRAPFGDPSKNIQVNRNSFEGS